MELALGPLAITKSEFGVMDPIEVFMRFFAHKQEHVREEHLARTQCFYMVVTSFGGTKIKHPWQLWKIPEIDGDIARKLGYTTVREMTSGEKKLHKMHGGASNRRRKHI